MCPIMDSSAPPYPKDGSDSERVKWRNAICDVQALWSHIHAGNDVFVSRDRNFHKASKLPKLLSLIHI